MFDGVPTPLGGLSAKPSPTKVKECLCSQPCPSGSTRPALGVWVASHRNEPPSHINPLQESPILSLSIRQIVRVESKVAPRCACLMHLRKPGGIQTDRTELPS